MLTWKLRPEGEQGRLGEHSRQKGEHMGRPEAGRTGGSRHQNREGQETGRSSSQGPDPSGSVWALRRGLLGERSPRPVSPRGVHRICAPRAHSPHRPGRTPSPSALIRVPRPVRTHSVASTRVRCEDPALATAHSTEAHAQHLSPLPSSGRTLGEALHEPRPPPLQNGTG